MLTLFVLAGVGNASELPGSAPTGSQSPCAWMIAHRDADTSLPDQIALAQANHELFTTADLRCLKANDVHKRVVEGARDGDLVALQAAKREAALAGRVEIDLLGVFIGPTKQDGSGWDVDRVPTEAVTAIRVLATVPAGPGVFLSGPKVDEIVAQMATLGLQGTVAPDVFGYAEVRGPNAPPSWNGTRLSLLSQAAPGHDNFYTNFPGSPAFTGIRMEEGDVVRVTLYDNDLVNPDSIAVIDLTRADIDAAMQQQGAVFLSVAERSQGAVLALQIAVRAADSSMPGVVGQLFRP